MEKFSSKFVEFFVSNNLIKNEDKEIYEYAFNKYYFIIVNTYCNRYDNRFML